MIDAERWNGWECLEAHPMFASDPWLPPHEPTRDAEYASRFYWERMEQDWRDYHADVGTDLKPIVYAESFLPEAMKTFAMIEEFQKDMLRSCGVPMKYLERDSGTEAE